MVYVSSHGDAVLGIQMGLEPPTATTKERPAWLPYSVRLLASLAPLPHFSLQDLVNALWVCKASVLMVILSGCDIGAIRKQYPRSAPRAQVLAR